MPNEGRLEISVSRRRVTDQEPFGHLTAGDYVDLRVTDSGMGMSRKQLDRAFEPFYTTKARGKGTGLGLETVHAIAEQNGGHTSIDSAPSCGTTIHVLLPLSDLEPLPHTEKPAQPRSSDGGGETILLVEDDRASRDLFDQVLRAEG